MATATPAAGPGTPRVPAAEAPLTPLIVTKYLPQTVGGRSVRWLPEPIRKTFNFCCWIVGLELLTTVVSIGFGSIRGGSLRVAAGIQAVLLAVSCLGLLGVVKVNGTMTVVHSIISTFLPPLFSLFLIVEIATAKGGSSTDALIIVMLGSFLFDIAAGLSTGLFTWRLRRYIKQCEQGRAMEDAEIEARMREDGILPPLPAHGHAGGAPVALARPVQPRIASLSNPAASQGQGGSRGNRGDDADDDVSCRKGNGSGTATASNTASKFPGQGQKLGVNGTATSTASSSSSSSSSSSTAAGNSFTSAAASAAGSTGVNGAAAVLHPDSASSASSMDQSTANTCSICLTAPRNSAFIHCGHTACESCARTVLMRYHRCHICRANISDIMRIYD